jgi:CheY-like chemotaxis protein
MNFKERFMEDQDLCAKRILVADADATDREACLARLRQVGLQAQGLRDLNSLTQALSGSDLVVTDWGWGPGGQAGLFYLRQLQPWVRPVILFSRQPDRQERHTAGLDRYVAKPNFQLLLKTVVMELLKPVPALLERR